MDRWMNDSWQNTRRPTRERKVPQTATRQSFLAWTATRSLVAIGRIYARAFHRLQVRTPCPLPKTGPAILVCNHTSGLDPVMIQSACGRLITWMMAREYYEISALRWGFELIQAIPVDRSGRDFAATRAALRALRAGQVLGIFPEGRLETSRELVPFETGAAMLAHHGRASVWPAYIDGSQRVEKDMLAAYLRPQSVSLTFGRRVCLKFDEDPDFDASTRAIRAAIERIRQASSSTLVRSLLAGQG